MLVKAACAQNNAASPVLLPSTATSTNGSHPARTAATDTQHTCASLLTETWWSQAQTASREVVRQCAQSEPNPHGDDAVEGLHGPAHRKVHKHLLCLKNLKPKT